MSTTAIIYGVPIGKPRMTRADRWKKRPCVMRYRVWADLARQVVYGDLAMKARLLAPTEIVVMAYFEPPKGKRRLGPHTQKPDGDNILKAVCDALFQNDEMIYKKTVEKYWTNGKARVEVTHG